VKVLPVGGAAKAIQEAVRIARAMRTVQIRYRLDMPTRVHSDASGLTQLWAEEVEWEYLMSLTNLDEGDVVRIFRRTLDMLEQIAHAPMLDDALHALARETARLLNREPVREVM
jgi:superfamily II RNA helicase